MNILTFDIEDWFHILDHPSTETETEWSRYPARIHENMDRIFQMLDGGKTTATFFCLGWIAEKHPDVVKKIDSLGYEIGSHTRMHQLVYNQTPTDFRNDVEKSIKTLEDLTGKKVKYFRAPGFSIRQENTWAFEVLAELGIEVDCSVFPAPRAHGGLPNYTQPVPSLLKYKNVTLKELPINYIKLMGQPFIFSGGGYFRLFPYDLIKRWTNRSDYVMSYLHPRDFDPGQPVLEDLSLARRFKSYVGLKTAAEKLQRWLKDFQFIDVTTAVKTIDWASVPEVIVE